MSDKQWHDQLTSEQRETVERAARAAANNPSPHVGFAADWGSLGKYGQEAACSDILAALRASAHPAFPPPKVPTRGEAVAEDAIEIEDGDHVVVSRREGGKLVNRLWLNDQTYRNGRCGRATAEMRLGDMRKWLATIVDAERASARAEAFDEAVRVTNNHWSPSRDELVKSFRALAAKEAR